MNLDNIIDFVNYFGLTQIKGLFKIDTNLSTTTCLKLLKLQQHYQLLIINSLPNVLYTQYIMNVIEGIYITLSDNKNFESKPNFIQVDRFGQQMKFPDITVPGKFRPNLPVLRNGLPGFSVKTGSIDLSTSFWLKNFPWNIFDVGIAGGYILSSLQGTLNITQDINLYLLDDEQLNDLLTYFSNLRPDVRICTVRTNKVILSFSN